MELKGNYDLKNPNDRKNLEEKIVDLNAKLLSSINAYTKGKKSVRGTRDGQKRFDNSLDALGILIHYAPGTRQRGLPRPTSSGADHAGRPERQVPNLNGWNK